MSRKIKNINLNIFFLLPVLAVVFLLVNYFTNNQMLNRLEAIPSFYLSSDSTAGNTAAGTLISALSSTGFTLGSSALVNSVGTSLTSTSFTYTSDGNTSTAFTKPFGMSVSGNYLYVSHNDDDRVSIYDISTTDSPTYVTSFSTNCTIGDLLVSSSTLYVTNYTSNNFSVYDLSASSTSPTFVRNVTTGTYPIGIAKSAANYIYVTNNTDNTVKIYNAASSTNPTLSATYSLAVNNPTGIAITGTNMYIANYAANTFSVYSISTPAAPTTVTTVNTGTNPMLMKIYNNVLLVSDYGANTVHQYNITTTSAPVASGNASFSAGGTSPTGIAFSSDGKEAYVANSGSNTFTAYSMGKEKYVSWDWKCDTTSGCTILTYTGTGAAHAISHSLGATPAFMIIKRTDTTGDWIVYHQSLGNTQYLLLDTYGAATTDGTMWNNTSPTSANFTVGTNASVNTNGGSYIAYLFAEKPGFSKFGSYTGNGSADGAFVYTGFKPKFVVWKNSSNGTSWWRMRDSARDSSNVTVNDLYPNYNFVENNSTGRYMDLISNGFKSRSTDTDTNGSGNTMVYAAFAEYPFEYASTNSGLTVASSTRFNGTNAYLNKTIATTGSRTTFTISAWVKRGSLTSAANQGIYSTVNSDSSSPTNMAYLAFTTSDQLEFSEQTSGSYINVVRSTAVFRDPSKWYHIVVAVDTTQLSPANRVKMYVDNQQITSFSNLTYPTLNYTYYVDQTGNVNHIGNSLNTFASFLKGYISDFYLVDGQQLAPSSFAQSDTNGRWSPKTYSGTYGTNGIHLQFANASAPGTDTSGQGNNYTNNNIATTDNLADSPTNNYAVMNPIAGNGYSNSTANISSGNLYTTGTIYAKSNIGLKTGKWYWEYTLRGTCSTGGNCESGIENESTSIYDRYSQDGTNEKNGAANSAYGTSFTTGDTVGVALDATNGTVEFFKNNVSQGVISSLGSGPFFASNYIGNAGGAFEFNFGQGGQTGLTYDSASGGYFRFTPPSGYVAISSANMISRALTSTSLIISNNYFNSIIYNGNGSAQTISSLNFQPDFIWIKDRSSAVSHVLFGDGSTIVNTVTSFFQWFEF